MVSSVYPLSRWVPSHIYCVIVRVMSSTNPFSGCVPKPSLSSPGENGALCISTVKVCPSNLYRLLMRMVPSAYSFGRFAQIICTIFPWEWCTLHTHSQLRCAQAICTVARFKGVLKSFLFSPSQNGTVGKFTFKVCPGHLLLRMLCLSNYKSILISIFSSWEVCVVLREWAD